jgi:hypothetical protein
MRSATSSTTRYLPLIFATVFLIILSTFLLLPSETTAHLSDTYSYLSTSPKQWLSGTSGGAVSGLGSTVVFALICYGEDTAYETAMLVKVSAFLLEFPSHMGCSGSGGPVHAALEHLIGVKYKYPPIRLTTTNMIFPIIPP